MSVENVQGKFYFFASFLFKSPTVYTGLVAYYIIIIIISSTTVHIQVEGNQMTSIIWLIFRLLHFKIKRFLSICYRTHGKHLNLGRLVAKSGDGRISW
jgi:hypothetical protein